MKKISIEDFVPIDTSYTDFRYFRVDSRTCSTRFLILRNGKTLLIDAGDGNDELDFTPDICILTHGHYDHAKGVKADWPLVYVSANEDFALPYVEVPKHAKPLAEGKFNFEGIEFEIIYTPGHTSGGLCLFEPNSGILFAGDTKFANGLWGRTDLGGSDEEIKASLEKLEKLGWKILCPAHGKFEKRE